MSNDISKKPANDQPNVSKELTTKLPAIEGQLEELPEGELDDVAGGLVCVGTCNGTST